MNYLRFIRVHCALIVAFAVFAPTRSAWAHNGAVSIAYPIDTISVDGDLSDWPQGLPSYAIARTEFGDEPHGKTDLSGHFRIGYDVKNSALYVAVEVIDDSNVAGPGSQWDAQDGCDVYLDRGHLEKGSSVEQYAQLGSRLAAIGQQAAKERVVVGVKRVGSNRVYEWSIHLDDTPAAGQAFGLDVALSDKDADDSFSWLSWGKGTQKVASSDRCGYMLLVDTSAKMGQVRGRVVWKKRPQRRMDHSFPDVRLESLDSKSLWTSLVCKQDGTYEATLPAGTYNHRLVDTARFRVVDSPRTEFRVESSDRFELEDISLSPLPIKNTQREFPGKEWNRIEAAESIGYSSEKLRGLRRYIVTDCNTTGLYVAVGGRVLLEFGDIEELSYIASVRKSILAMLFGKYVENGTIDLDKTLTQLHIDDNEGLLPVEKLATVRHLISARSGVYHPASNRGDDTQFAPARGSQTPGDYFLYNNWDFNTAGAVFEMLTGQNIYDALERDLAMPIGMQDFHRWKQQKFGDYNLSRYPAYHIYLSTRDMARVGHLMLRDGNWDGEQVIPKEWTRQIVSVATARESMNPASLREGEFAYGYMWWLWDNQKASDDYQGAFTAQGAWGQYITVLPSLDMVVAHKTKDDYERPTSWEAYKGLLNRIIDARQTSVRATFE